MQQHRNFEQELDGVFQAYREALPDPDAGPLFAPRLWEKIDAQRAFAFSVRRWTRTLVTAAVALCALMAVLLFNPQEKSPVYSATYVEILSQEQPNELLALVDFDPPGEFNQQ